MPSRSKPWQTALEAPPVPRTRARRWWGRRKGRMLSVKPMMSELNPLRWRCPSLSREMRMTLTAPIAAASSESSSRRGMTACLWGMVTLRPRRSGCSSRRRGRASMDGSSQRARERMAERVAEETIEDLLTALPQREGVITVVKSLLCHCILVFWVGSHCLPLREGESLYLVARYMVLSPNVKRLYCTLLKPQWRRIGTRTSACGKAAIVRGR